MSLLVSAAEDPRALEPPDKRQELEVLTRLSRQSKEAAVEGRDTDPSQLKPRLSLLAEEEPGRSDARTD